MIQNRTLELLPRAATIAFSVIVPAISGCNPAPPVEPTPQWQLVLSELPGGLLSVSGTSATDIYAVGADPGDGDGPQILHYDGQQWMRKVSGATGSDLWWISDHMIGDSFYMVGEDGLILRYRPVIDTFEQHDTPGNETLFGVWGLRSEFVVAVGGDVGNPDTSGVIWEYDGTQWTAIDVTSIDSLGIPALFKVWGRSENEIYAVGARGVILRYDGTSWTRLDSPTTRSLFTVHGNDDIVIACGGAQSGVLIESTTGAFVDVTPPGLLQMNGAFAPPDTVGDPLVVGREGAVAFRRNGQWVSEDTGLDLSVLLDYHATWVDPDGGVWAVGGNIIGEPRTDGILSYFGTQQAPTAVGLDSL